MGYVTKPPLPELTEEELVATPVFPLPRVTLLPGAGLPLHIFEMRYRQLIVDALERGPRIMAVARLLPGYESDYRGRPPIATIAGVGRILWHEELEDGRHNIVIAGMARCSLEELPPGELPYRRAKATVLAEHGSVADDAWTTLLELVTTLSALVRRKDPDFELGIEVHGPQGRVVDAITDRWISDPDVQQAVLEALDVAERARLVTAALTDLLGELAADGGSRTVH